MSNAAKAIEAGRWYWHRHRTYPWEARFVTLVSGRLAWQQGGAIRYVDEAEDQWEAIPLPEELAKLRAALGEPGKALEELHEERSESIALLGEAIAPLTSTRQRPPWTAGNAKAMLAAASDASRLLKRIDGERRDLEAECDRAHSDSLRQSERLVHAHAQYDLINAENRALREGYRLLEAVNRGPDISVIDNESAHEHGQQTKELNQAHEEWLEKHRRLAGDEESQ